MRSEEYIKDGFFGVIRHLLPFFLVISYIVPYSRLLSRLVNEKETKVK